MKKSEKTCEKVMNLKVFNLETENRNVKKIQQLDF